MNRPSSASPGPEARLPDALLSPQAWPEGTGPVELVETHISWVFLAGQLAYKVKKPVKLDFLDFSTRELRDHFCEEELRINRRFAPDNAVHQRRLAHVRSTQNDNCRKSTHAAAPSMRPPAVAGVTMIGTGEAARRSPSGMSSRKTSPESATSGRR